MNTYENVRANKDKNSNLLRSLINALNGLFFDYKISDNINTNIINIKG